MCIRCVSICQSEKKIKIKKTSGHVQGATRPDPQDGPYMDFSMYKSPIKPTVSSVIYEEHLYA